MSYKDKNKKKEAQREWRAKKYKENPDWWKDYLIKWREKHPKHLEQRKKYYLDNKDKISEYVKHWRETNKDGVLSQSIKRYGISIEEYKKLYEKQNGCCAICGLPIDRLHVDHCHSTGEIRGLLCRQCNTGLGFLKEDKNLLLKAIEYLEYYGN